MQNLDVTLHTYMIREGGICGEKRVQPEEAGGRKTVSLAEKREVQCIAKPVTGEGFLSPSPDPQPQGSRGSYCCLERERILTRVLETS